ncbi:MAG: transposase [Elusimicrobia bacterium]|nr:transposase [Elusimicrobiota bacterium]
MTRGDGGREIFSDANDYRYFEELLEKAKKRFHFMLYGYCLMPNHVHLLMQTCGIPASRVMHWLLTCYAKEFNHLRARAGHVFKERYTAPLCMTDSYFTELLRYIHLNPVRAGLVESPDKWPWSGHGELTGNSRSRLLDGDFPLSFFASTKEEARRTYLDFISRGVPEGFQERKETVLSAKEEPALLCAKVSLPTTDWKELIKTAPAAIGSDLLGKSRVRQIARARRALIRKMVSAGAVPVEVAAFFNCSQSLVSKAMGEDPRSNT